MIGRAILGVTFLVGLATPSCGGVRPQASLAPESRPRILPISIPGRRTPRLEDLCGSKQVALCEASCAPLARISSIDALPEAAAADAKAYKACEARRAACAACLATIQREGLVE